MRIYCDACGRIHIDEGEYATKPHHTHACQHCGNVWRPAIVNTVGVRFLPGFKDQPETLANVGQQPDCDYDHPHPDHPCGRRITTERPWRLGPHYCCVCDMPAVAAELGQWYCNAHRSGR